MLPELFWLEDEVRPKLLRFLHSTDSAAPWIALIAALVRLHAHALERLMVLMLRDRHISNALSLACEFALHVLVPWRVVWLKGIATNFSKNLKTRFYPPSVMNDGSKFHFAKKIFVRSDRSRSDFSLSGRANRSKYLPYWWPTRKKYRSVAKENWYLLSHFFCIFSFRFSKFFQMISFRFKPTVRIEWFAILLEMVTLEI